MGACNKKLGAQSSLPFRIGTAQKYAIKDNQLYSNNQETRLPDLNKLRTFSYEKMQLVLFPSYEKDPKATTDTTGVALPQNHRGLNPVQLTERNSMSA